MIMENIEQLKQENAKLTERLNNAAKFFREQKTQIEVLTKENDELKHDAESFNSLQENYENTIKSKDLDFKALQDTYNELFEDCNKSKKEIEELKSKYKENDIAKGEAELNLDSINKQYKDIFKEQEKEINDLKNQLSEKTKMYDEVFNASKELGIEIAELKTKSENCENVAANKQKVIEKLENNIDSKDKAYKVLQDTYNEVFTELEQFKKKYQARKEKEVELLKTIEDNKLDYDKLNKEYKTLNDIYNKLNNEYSDICTKYNDLEQGRIKSEEQLNTLNTLCNQFKEDNKVLQDKYDKLDKLYDDCENEKLALQNDYNTLSDKIKTMDLDMTNKDETIKSYQNELYNENIYRYNKEDINKLCDQLLDFFATKKLVGE